MDLQREKDRALQLVTWHFHPVEKFHRTCKAWSQLRYRALTGLLAGEHAWLPCPSKVLRSLHSLLLLCEFPPSTPQDFSAGLLLHASPHGLLLPDRFPPSISMDFITSKATDMPAPDATGSMNEAPAGVWLGQAETAHWEPPVMAKDGSSRFICTSYPSRRKGCLASQQNACAKFHCVIGDGKKGITWKTAKPGLAGGIGELKRPIPLSQSVDLQEVQPLACTHLLGHVQDLAQLTILHLQHAEGVNPGRRGCVEQQQQQQQAVWAKIKRKQAMGKG
eukprot:1158937-Pelagomonas_calceolata.AAC.11